MIFTDLDGTLLDARTYTAEPARPALARLAAAGVPVVCCSSKTAAEQRALRRELGLERMPYIVENGAAVFVPEAAGLPVAEWPRVERDGRDEGGAGSGPGGGERVWALGRPAAEVRAGLARAAAAAGVRATGYGDLALEAVVAATGLDPAAAVRARQRDFSETVVDAFTAEDAAKLAGALAAEGLAWRHGGRFRTVTDARVDKGRAVRLLVGLYAQAAGRAPETVGIGDSANDAALLAAVDRAYLLARPDGSWVPMEIGGVRRIDRPGPEGWSRVIDELLG